MTAWRKALYFFSFLGLAATSALALARIGSPSPASAFLVAALLASLAGAPGLAYRHAWPAAPILLALGAYVVALVLAPGTTAHGLGSQLDFFARQLHLGADEYLARHLPFAFQEAPALRFFLAFVVYVVVGGAAFSALSCRRALPAVALLLALLGFALTIDGVQRTLWLPMAFLIFAGCLLAVSHGFRRRPWPATTALAGITLTVAAGLFALLLLGTTPIAAGTPWQDWRTWGPINLASATTRLNFDWMVDFPTLLNPQEDARVLTVKSPVAAYWRANALDYFNGVSWFAGNSTTTPLHFGSGPLAGARIVPASPFSPPGRTVTEVFTLNGLVSDYFFSGGAPRVLRASPVGASYSASTGAVAGQRPLGPQATYTLQAIVPALAPRDLVGRGRDYPLAVEEYTTLPFPNLDQMGRSVSADAWRDALGDDPGRREWVPLLKLNRAIVGSATDPYAITLRVEQYLRTNYIYSLTPPQTSFVSPYAAFLFKTHVGYCQHFAGAMAVLLRFNGIPARVAVGFATGQRTSPDTFVVKRSDAHAWVEAFFPGVGWVTFDPTPGHSVPGSSVSSTSVGFVDPFVAAGGAAGASASAPPAATVARRQQDRAGGLRGGGAAATAQPSRTPWWLAWPTVPGAALLLWPLVRAARRRRATQRGTAEQRLRASLSLLRAELRDYGVEVPRSLTLAETADLLDHLVGARVDTDRSARSVAAGEPRPATQPSATSPTALLCARLEAIFYGGRPATRADVAQLAALRRELRHRLRKRVGPLPAMLTLYGLSRPAGRRLDTRTPAFGR